MSRERLSATVEADLLRAGREAVDQGRASNLSEWVNDALRRQVEHERRLVGLADFVAAYEDEYGEISAEEMVEAARRARQRAIVVRTPPASEKPRARTKRGAA
jgi:hypothetical protein